MQVIGGAYIGGLTLLLLRNHFRIKNYSSARMACTFSAIHVGVCFEKFAVADGPVLTQILALLPALV
jgi:hypothetical protein